MGLSRNLKSKLKILNQKDRMMEMQKKKRVSNQKNKNKSLSNILILRIMITRKEFHLKNMLTLKR